MQKITVNIDLTKIDKTRIVERKYTNAAGVEITAKEYKMDVVEVKPENFKTIASGDTWALVKKFFVADSPTKEERAAQTKTNFVGDGVVFVDLQPQDTAQPSANGGGATQPSVNPNVSNPQDAQDAPAIVEGDIPW